MAVLSVFSTGRDPSYFSQPDLFLPQRWEETSSQGKDCCGRQDDTEGKRSVTFGLMHCIYFYFLHDRVSKLINSVAFYLLVSFLCFLTYFIFALPMRKC